MAISFPLQRSQSSRIRLDGYQWRSLLTCIVISALTLILFPIAKQHWPRIPAFLFAYQTAIIGTYAIAAYLIQAFYKETKAISLLYLWVGCVYTSAILVVQFLSFPNAFINAGPLIGGQQTTIWLWCFWHFGPSIMMLMYSWSELHRPGLKAIDSARGFRRASWLASVCILTTIAAVTTFHDQLPILDINGDFTRITSSGIAPVIQLTIVAALVMLWRATRFKSSLNAWLGVALLALLLDNSITMAGGTRLSVGWYIGRINALISALVMLGIYLKEINSGYLASRENAKKLAEYQLSLEKMVSERTRALDDTRAALLHSQKLEAVGKLTGGVAHDFNNVLHIIGGNLELIQLIAHDNQKVLSRLVPAQMAVERGSKLSSQLLAFARKQPLQPTTVNPCKIVLGMDLLLKRAVGECIEIENIYCEDVWNTSVDPHQLENMILNLVLNAKDAISSQGKLTIEIRNAILTEAEIAEANDVIPGEYVMLAIHDTGSGMTAEVKERAFEPFFTTKEVGKGTGLGLSMTYGFVKQSRGHIQIESQPGRGTTIRIYLPRSFENEITDAMEVPRESQSGTETILVVEDDLAVQTVVIEMLSSLGYRILKADNPEAALAHLGMTTQIDLLFTDVVMPGNMNSIELARYATVKRPGIRVLFTSGYTRDEMMHHGRLDAGVQLLSKPYSRDDLATAVHKALVQRLTEKQISAV